MEERLSERELEVALLVCEHLTQDEIGVRLGISGRTVRHHLGNVRYKLHVERTREIPATLKKLGLLLGEDEA